MPSLWDGLTRSVLVHADENGAGANVGAEDDGLVSVVSTVDSLAVAGVDSDVGHACATVCVVDKVARLRFGADVLENIDGAERDGDVLECDNAYG